MLLSPGLKNGMPREGRSYSYQVSYRQWKLNKRQVFRHRSMISFTPAIYIPETEQFVQKLDFNPILMCEK